MWGLCFPSAPQFRLCSRTPPCFGAFFVRQWGCVECSDRNWKYVRFCAGSKRPSLSFCQRRQNADCHIWLRWLPLLRTLKPAPDIFVISGITLFPLCASLLTRLSLLTLCLFLPFAESCGLNRGSENISACKPRGEGEGESKTGCQGLVFVSVYIFRDASVY